MKNIFISVISIGLVSCAHLTYSSRYSADTTGQNKCTLVVLDNSMIQTISEQSEKEMLDAMKKVGYSDCKFERNESGLLTVCQNPILYKTLFTKNMAECHKFLKDNKINGFTNLIYLIPFK